jgi:hypothetical protein
MSLLFLLLLLVYWRAGRRLRSSRSRGSSNNSALDAQLTSIRVDGLLDLQKPGSYCICTGGAGHGLLHHFKAGSSCGAVGIRPELLGYLASFIDPAVMVCSIHEASPVLLLLFVQTCHVRPRRVVYASLVCNIIV